MKEIIDINFNFTTDSPFFWNNYWDNKMGKSSVDPDIVSKTLRYYHKVVWSKKLPNGEDMNLKEGVGANYLTWKNFRFGSDIIVTSFRYKKYSYMIEQVIKYLPDYKKYIEDYTKKSYTFGGSIIFPKMQGSINQDRGCHSLIRDRFDLTLECIRLFYNNEQSPLFETLKRNKNFFDLFVNFKGYVEFFYLQDLVNENFTKVNFWLGDGNFERNPLPKTVEEYLSWIEKQLQFVQKRGERISDDVNKKHGE